MVSATSTKSYKIGVNIIGNIIRIIILVLSIYLSREYFRSISNCDAYYCKIYEDFFKDSSKQECIIFQKSEFGYPYIGMHDTAIFFINGFFGGDEDDESGEYEVLIADLKEKEEKKAHLHIYVTSKFYMACVYIALILMIITLLIRLYYDAIYILRLCKSEEGRDNLRLRIIFKTLLSELISVVLLFGIYMFKFESDSIQQLITQPTRVYALGWAIGLLVTATVFILVVLFAFKSVETQSSKKVWHQIMIFLTIVITFITCHKCCQFRHGIHTMVLCFILGRFVLYILESRLIKPDDSESKKSINGDKAVTNFTLGNVIIREPNAGEISSITSNEATENKTNIHLGFLTEKTDPSKMKEERKELEPRAPQLPEKIIQRKAAESIVYEYYCPITKEIMDDPVVAADGRSYERAAIEKWLLTKNTSPSTNLPLTSNNLIPNIQLKNLIQDYQSKQIC